MCETETFAFCLNVETETETKFWLVSVSKLPNIETWTNIISLFSKGRVH